MKAIAIKRIKTKLPDSLSDHEKEDMAEEIYEEMKALYCFDNEFNFTSLM